MEHWQAFQSWAIFAALGGLAYYYYAPKSKKTPKPEPPKETKKEVKKTARKPAQEKSSTPSAVAEDVKETVAQKQNGNKKRKANALPTLQTETASSAKQSDDHDEIDMSTRQFAASMQKARDGIQVTSSNNKNQNRTKTVKPKASNAPLSSGSSQADAEDDWSPAVSPAPNANSIDDMLEPVASGPSSLRITPSQQPVKEKAQKHAKKVETESKKQRQNRKKVEERQEQAAAAEAERKVAMEKQRRTARESRNEPAKNGIPVQPVNNPWAEKNAARDAQLPAVTSEGKSVQLLDTFETESNSSSNPEASTAATSMTDTAPSRWADDLASGEDDYAKALEESERETGWSEVKSSKKSKKKANDANVAPTQVANEKAKAANSKPVTKATGFAALNDESTIESSSWDP